MRGRLLHTINSLALSVTCGDTSPKGRGLGKEMKFVWTAKGSHFGGAGIEQSEMTERARMLPLYNNFFLRKRAASSAIVGTFDDSNKKLP